MISLVLTPYRLVELLNSLSGLFVTEDRRGNEVLLRGQKAKGRARFEYSEDCLSVNGHFGCTLWYFRLCKGGKYEYSVNSTWPSEFQAQIFNLLSIRLPAVLNTLLSYFSLAEVDVVDFVDRKTANDVIRGFAYSGRLGLLALSTPREAFVGLFHRGRLEEGKVIREDMVKDVGVVYVPRAESLVLGAFSITPSNVAINKIFA